MARETPQPGDVVVSVQVGGGRTIVVSRPLFEYLSRSLYAKTTPQMTKVLLRLWWRAFKRRWHRFPQPTEYQRLDEWLRIGEDS